MFWDYLSKVQLIKRALDELNRQSLIPVHGDYGTNNSSFGVPKPWPFRRTSFLPSLVLRQGRRTGVVAAPLTCTDSLLPHCCSCLVLLLMARFSLHEKTEPVNGASIMARERATRRPGDSTSDESCEKKAASDFGLEGVQVKA
jgi:hypothetical protein